MQQLQAIKAAIKKKRGTLTDFSGLLYVESVGDESEVGVDESQSLGHVLLHVVAGVEYKLQPATQDINITYL